MFGLYYGTKLVGPICSGSKSKTYVDALFSFINLVISVIFNLLVECAAYTFTLLEKLE